MDRRILGLGEGCRLEMSLESPPGGRGKARRGRWVPADPMQVTVVFWKQLRARRTGPQELSFILLFKLVKHGARVETSSGLLSPVLLGGLIKGAQPLPTSPLGMKPIRALGSRDFRGTLCPQA